jgi:hypothetical protein
VLSLDPATALAGIDTAARRNAVAARFDRDGPTMLGKIGTTGCPAAINVSTPRPKRRFMAIGSWADGAKRANTVARLWAVGRTCSHATIVRSGRLLGRLTAPTPIQPSDIAHATAPSSCAGLTRARRS